MEEKDWHNKCFYRISIKAVIINAKGQLLLVREKNNPNWNLPGGGMDYGEDEQTALRRELHEEVGFNGDFTYTPLGIRPGYIKDKAAWQLWIVYKVVPAGFDFSVGEEADEVAFLDPKKVEDLRPYIMQFYEMAVTLK